MSIPVNIDNFVHAETSRQFERMAKMARGMNRFAHAKSVARLDRQVATRMNRDTIYSSALVDVSASAYVSFPDAGDRYLSIQVIDDNHYTTGLYHGGGTIELDSASHGSEFVAVIARIFADPHDAEDLAEVHRLQAAITVEANADRPYQRPDYDEASQVRTAQLLRQLGEDLTGAEYCNGSREEVQQARHLVTSAYGWGGLPTREVVYVSDASSRPRGDYALKVPAVPVDGFWSISIYNGAGYFEENPFDSYSVNSVTAKPGADGRVTIHLGVEPKGSENFLYLPERWNTLVRFYQPREEIRTGEWVFPGVESTEGEEGRLKLASVDAGAEESGIRRWPI